MVRYSTNNSTGQQNVTARYTLAINRTFSKNGQNEADFINCVCFGKTAEFAEKYLKKGTKIAVVGSIITNSYTNKDGQKVYTTEVNVREHEFVESKASAQQYQQNGGQYAPQSQGYQQPAPQQTQQYGGYQQNPAQNPYPQNPTPAQSYSQESLDGFMNIPDGIGADELPFA